MIHTGRKLLFYGIKAKEVEGEHQKQSKMCARVYPYIYECIFMHMHQKVCINKQTQTQM